MDPTGSSELRPPASNPAVDDTIRHFPASAQAAFHRFLSTGDQASLDPVVFAILQHYIPRKTAKPLVEYPGTALLVEDLGFDSIAIAEVVFFTEELFDIAIANKEIIRVRTLDDVRSFVRRKVATRAAS